MKILSLEFSSTQRSVAILDARKEKLEAAVAESGGRSTKAFSLIEKALAEAGATPSDIDCLAIGIGPGSYTGIRAAISIAQGWQIAREVKIIGVSSVKAIAFGLISREMKGTVHVVVDAQKNEFYLAGYNVSEGAVQETQSLKIVSVDAVKQLVNSGGIMFGPDLGSQFANQNLYPEAASIAMLAHKEPVFMDGDKLEPIYLRETTFVKAPPGKIIS